MDNPEYWQTQPDWPSPIRSLASARARHFDIVKEELAKAHHNVLHLLVQKTCDPDTIKTCMSWARQHTVTASARLSELSSIAPAREWRNIISRELKVLDRAGNELDNARLYGHDIPAANGFLVMAERHIQTAIREHARLARTA